MIKEKGGQGKTKHGGHKEEEKNSKFEKIRIRWIPGPKCDEIWQNCEEPKETKNETVAKEKDEKFVVAKIDARIYPKIWINYLFYD